MMFVGFVVTVTIINIVVLIIIVNVIRSPAVIRASVFLVRDSSEQILYAFDHTMQISLDIPLSVS